MFFGKRAIEKVSDCNQNLMSDRLEFRCTVSAKNRKNPPIGKAILNFESVLPKNKCFGGILGKKNTWYSDFEMCIFLLLNLHVQWKKIGRKF